MEKHQHAAAWKGRQSLEECRVRWGSQSRTIRGAFSYTRIWVSSQPPWQPHTASLEIPPSITHQGNHQFEKHHSTPLEKLESTNLGCKRRAQKRQPRTTVWAASSTTSSRTGLHWREFSTHTAIHSWKDLHRTHHRMVVVAARWDLRKPAVTFNAS